VIRILGGGLIGLLLFGLWLYCVFDVISTDSVVVRNLPKLVWLLIVLFIPTIGSIAWLALGRPQFANWRPGGQYQPPRRVVGPEDLPTYPAPGGTATPDSRLQAWEDDLHRREEELRRRREEGDDPGGSGDQ
jgi:hypothetical protein